jgi:hypothetical protein
MRLGRDQWNQVADTLSENDLVSLIKALTLLEQYPGFRAGGVAPVIWLFRCLPDGNARVALVNWILGHTENEYVPFGTSNHGAKSLDEYHRRCEQIAAARQIQRTVAEDQQRKVKEHEATLASQKLFGAVRRRDAKAVQALLNRGADWNATDDSGQSARELALSQGLGRLFGLTEP